MSFTLTNEPSGFARTTIRRIPPRLQSSLRAHRVSELLPARNRLASYLARGIARLFCFCTGADDVGTGDAKLRELIRFDPTSASRIGRRRKPDVSNSRHSRELIDKVDVAVVREKNSVVGAFGRIERDQQQWRPWSIF
jgi:hypothetical protein